ncbi:LOW QUALITY PROTEIN: DALR anticodon-binding domain-containing protein 3 [Accipiter gentilis]|uniref:LOW QUALITY PROTEIN: DALR anticodon-binding domain-containing protein 3 n=1 Tax=Astur gentilis TaxID=8957 RepID=UPI00210FEB71|nr:LOW QUALITY PROTEIN: DALR anticodon-binding domain-containing protein 3 [Accipiter gentilis]
MAAQERCAPRPTWRPPVTAQLGGRAGRDVTSGLSGGSAGRAPMDTGEGRPGVAATLRALNGALGRPAALWVKENGARNLRHRDFLAPRAALNAAFPGGQVPADVMAGVTSLGGPGVLAVRGCQETPAGLAVQVRRPEAFRRLLAPLPGPAPVAGLQAGCVVLHCPALRGPAAALRPRHLRTVLLADHLAQLLRAQGVGVRLVPALAEEGSREVLRRLRVDWPSGSGGSALPDTVLALQQALGRSPCATACEQGPGTAALPEDVICKVHLKSFVEQQGLVGYDPNLDVLLVTEGKLRSLAELQQAVLQCAAGGQGSCCSIVHVVSCEEEFRQQQLDLLWRILDPGAHTALQKHLVCGPVTVTNPSSPIGADQYFQLRKRQMYEASVMKYGELAQDEAWTEVIDTLTVAAIRFEMLSTAHRSQITLDLEDSSISTKGTKSGAFVMYNCARLATLFDTYQRAVERGTYPALPPVSELNFSCLREEGEWLLLFNYLLPFPEVLQQAAELPTPTKGIRITANTETVCKFLIQLSMDFSSYYNRVHVLGEPFPHLFDQMFARLQLLGAVRDMFHSALATLHLPPLSQI